MNVGVVALCLPLGFATISAVSAAGAAEEDCFGAADAVHSKPLDVWTRTWAGVVVYEFTATGPPSAGGFPGILAWAGVCRTSPTQSGAADCFAALTAASQPSGADEIIACIESLGP